MGNVSRLSTDELAADGTIRNGFDYNVQVWVQNGRVVDCGHPASMKSNPVYPCCPAHEFAGREITSVPEHEVR
jgi:hypothetical protein